MAHAVPSSLPIHHADSGGGGQGWHPTVLLVASWTAWRGLASRRDLHTGNAVPA